MPQQHQVTLRRNEVIPLIIAIAFFLGVLVGAAFGAWLASPDPMDRGRTGQW